MENQVILIVDDEEDIRTTLAEILFLLGYETESVASGEEALEIFDETRHALVITDYHMPGIHGDELIRILRLRCPTLPVIAITGVAGANVEKALLAAGVDECLWKPFDIQRFREVVKAVLEKKKQSNLPSQ